MGIDIKRKGKHGRKKGEEGKERDGGGDIRGRRGDVSLLQTVLYSSILNLSVSPVICIYEYHVLRS